MTRKVSHEATGKPAPAVGRFSCQPHPVLRPFVVEYWASARDLAAMGGLTITPDCYGELVCCAEELYAVGEGGRERLPACFLVGLLTEPLRFEAAGVVHCMAARIYAWTLGTFAPDARDLKVPARGWLDASDVFGSRRADILKRVQRCDWISLTGVFDEVLVERLGRATPGDRMVGPFLGPLRRPTAAVAGERATSGRQLERQVRRLTGTSPRQLACLARFQQVRDAIWNDPDTDLSRLAHEAGYADQPHMTRHSAGTAA